VNWTASSAGAPAGAAPAAAGAGPPGQDDEATGDAPAGRAEPAAAVDELGDVLAHPAARPAAANATIVEYTVRRVINGVSFVTFQRALYRLARS
jgi:hypothetical protein